MMTRLHTKLLLCFLMLTGLLTGCQEEAIEPLSIVDNATERSSLLARKGSIRTFGIPTIRFKANKEDPRITESVSLVFAKMETQYLLNNNVGGVEVTGTTAEIGEVFQARWKEFPSKGKLTQEIKFSEKFQFEGMPIMDIQIVYFDVKGNQLGAEKASVAVFEDGRTALQAPLVEQVAIEQTEDGTAILRAVVADDPANQVAKVELQLGRIVSGPAPAKDLFSFTKGAYEQTWNTHDWETDWLKVSKEEAGEYEVRLTAYNRAGKAIYEPQDFTLNLPPPRSRSEFRGRIKRVRIRERDNGGDYNIIIDTDGDEEPDANSVINMQFLNLEKTIAPIAATYRKKTRRGSHRFRGKFSADLKSAQIYQVATKVGANRQPSVVFVRSWGLVLD